MKQHTIIFIYQDFFSQANTREYTMFTEVLPKLQTFLTDKCTGSVFRPCFGWSFLMPWLGLWNRISHPENSIVKFWSIHFLQKRNGKKCIFYKHINNIVIINAFSFLLDILQLPIPQQVYSYYKGINLFSLKCLKKFNQQFMQINLN